MQHVDEAVNSQLKERFQDKMTRLQKGEKKVFEDMFAYVCPKFISPYLPTMIAYQRTTTRWVELAYWYPCPFPRAFFFFIMLHTEKRGPGDKARVAMMAILYSFSRSQLSISVPSLWPR